MNKQSLTHMSKKATYIYGYSIVYLDGHCFHCQFY
mgnify:CR=1 FL=1